MEYEYNEIPIKNMEKGFLIPRNIFPDSYWTGLLKRDINAYLFASNIQNFYLGPIL